MHSYSDHNFREFNSSRMAQQNSDAMLEIILAVVYIATNYHFIANIAGAAESTFSCMKIQL